MCNNKGLIACENFKGPMKMVERDIIFNVQQNRVVWRCGSFFSKPNRPEFVSIVILSGVTVQCLIVRVMQFTCALCFFTNGFVVVVILLSAIHKWKLFSLVVALTSLRNCTPINFLTFFLPLESEECT